MSNKKYDKYGFRKKPKVKAKNESKNKYDNLKQTFTIIGLIGFFIFGVVTILMMFVSGFIAWNCYANDLHQIRLIKTFLAIIFCYLYIPYFIFLRIVLKSPCL